MSTSGTAGFDGPNGPVAEAPPSRPYTGDQTGTLRLD